MKFLIENFSKGSLFVLKNAQMVADLADAIRDDVRVNPSSFPPGSARTFPKTSDEELAKWFLENLDNIEREGYEGTIFSQDGKFNEWIVRRYIAGSHNWEDITGVLNMNLRDWKLLKNRNLLAQTHSDVPKFNSIRDLGSYLTTHYRDQLQDVRKAAKKAAKRKMAKTVKLVDNEDYRIYTTLNRAAGCLLGLGTQWCTANSKNAGHFHSYSSAGMLFQMFPYTDERDEAGKKLLSESEKYQFDGGTAGNFMTILDKPADSRYIREKYPYILSDLSEGLMQNKDKLEKAFEQLSTDPSLQGADHKIKIYNIEEEIKKLDKLKAKGYFTDLKRPREKDDNSVTDQPQEKPAMENADKDILEMLNSLKRYDSLNESKITEKNWIHTDPNKKGMFKGKSKAELEAERDRLKKKHENQEGKVSDADRTKMAELNFAIRAKSKGGLEEGVDEEHDGECHVCHKDPCECGDKKVDESADPEVIAWMERFNRLG